MKKGKPKMSALLDLVNSNPAVIGLVPGVVGMIVVMVVGVVAILKS